MESEKWRRCGAGTDQCARMNVSFGDDPVERRFERQILLQILDGLRLRLSSLDGVLVRMHECLRGFDGFLRDHHVVLGHDPGRCRRGLQSVVGASRACELGFGFSALEFQRLSL